MCTLGSRSTQAKHRSRTGLVSDGQRVARASNPGRSSGNFKDVRFCPILIFFFCGRPQRCPCFTPPVREFFSVVGSTFLAQEEAQCIANLTLPKILVFGPFVGHLLTFQNVPSTRTFEHHLNTKTGRSRVFVCSHEVETPRSRSQRPCQPRGRALAGTKRLFTSRNSPDAARHCGLGARRLTV